MAHIALTGIRTVVLDLDDTLIAERSFAFSGFKAVAAWLRARAPGSPDAEARMCELFDQGDRRRIFDQVLSEIGCTTLLGLVPEMVACYRDHVPAISLLDDARRALDRWRGRFFLGLISDGPVTMQQNKVSVLRLREQLDLVILTGAWGAPFGKPHPRAFEAMEQASGQEGAACIYLADNPAKDFIAPARLGWKTVRIRREQGIYAAVEAPTDGRPDYEAITLDEVDLSS